MQHRPNPNLSVERNIAVESGGFAVAEVGSAAVDLGVVGLIDLIIPKPVVEYGSQILAKYVIEPILDPIEKGITKVCKLEECQVDETKSREERAQKIGRDMIVFGTAGAVAFVSKLLIRRGWNEHFGIVEHNPAKFTLKDAGGVMPWISHHLRLDFMSPHEKMIMLADEGVHMTSLWLANNQMAPLTDKIIRHTSDILQSGTGMDKEKADDVSKMFAIWELPNLIGTAAGMGAIAGSHIKGWPNGKVGEILANKPRNDISHLEKLAAERAAAQQSQELSI